MKKLISIVLTLALMLGCVLLFTACSGGGETKDSYTVTYRFGYDVEDRTVTVKANTRANNLKPNRAGYTFDAWYADEGLTEAFDFSSYITEDVILYAGWAENKASLSLTFDYNYDGASAPAVMSVKEGETIPTSFIPPCPRLGMQFEGWYKDAACTEKWDLEQDTVTSSLTLYAKYEYDSTLSRNADGSLAYENVVITMWTPNDFNFNTQMNALVSAFNSEYEGKIKVIYQQGGDLAQDKTSLRMQQTYGVSNADVDYYAVRDIFDLAGIDYDPADFYANAAKDTYMNGAQYTVPFAASVPYLLYNVELMNKYNGTNPLPSSYSEFTALIQKAYEGEQAGNADFRGAVTGTDWMYKENAAFASFVQNGMPYYEVKDGKMTTSWALTGEPFDKAMLSLVNLHSLFGETGAYHGRAFGGGYSEQETIDAVANGKAFFGLFNWSVNTSNILKNSKIGVMPLSGLFSDEAGTKDLIPVTSIGLQFYKAKNVSLTELAAAALFADYLSENSCRFANCGWYPLNKSVAESDSWNEKVTATYRDFWAKAGDADSFMTMDGFSGGKALFNTAIAEGVLVEALQSELVDEATLRYYIESICMSIQGAVGK